MKAAALALALLIPGCAPSTYWTPTTGRRTPNEHLVEPSCFAREQEAAALLHYEDVTGRTLGPLLRECVHRYRIAYVAPTDYAEVTPCDGERNVGCHRMDRLYVKRCAPQWTEDRCRLWLMNITQHEVLHHILWCDGQPGSTDHTHPAFDRFGANVDLATTLPTVPVTCEEPVR